eukprot:5471370-Pyramimonas_sp.AAC.1
MSLSNTSIQIHRLPLRIPNEQGSRARVLPRRTTVLTYLYVTSAAARENEGGKRAMLRRPGRFGAVGPPHPPPLLLFSFPPCHFGSTLPKAPARPPPLSCCPL